MNNQRYTRSDTSDMCSTTQTLQMRVSLELKYVLSLFGDDLWIILNTSDCSGQK